MARWSWLIRLSEFIMCPAVSVLRFMQVYKLYKLRPQMVCGKKLDEALKLAIVRELLPLGRERASHIKNGKV